MAKRRTKKEKIRAKVRQDVAPSQEVNPKPINEYTYTFIDTPTQVWSKKTTGYISPEIGSVRADLRKTVIVTVLAFSLELCVYWVLRRGGWETINRFLNR